jgi:hypothetical protein
MCGQLRLISSLKFTKFIKLTQEVHTGFAVDPLIIALQVEVVTSLTLAFGGSYPLRGKISRSNPVSDLE